MLWKFTSVNNACLCNFGQPTKFKDFEVYAKCIQKTICGSNVFDMNICLGDSCLLPVSGRKSGGDAQKV